jgi:TATA-box binding protein (TBP) (component of TFIID and TFIIIB)
MATKIKRLNHVESVNFNIPEELKIYDNYPKITNYVSTVKLGLKFDLNIIPLYITGADKKPRRFAAITIRIIPTTCLLFSTGNMVIIGAKTQNASKLAAHTYRLFLEKIPQVFYDKKDKKFFYDTLEKYINFNEFTVRNVVGSGKLILNDKKKHSNLHNADTTILSSSNNNTINNSSSNDENFVDLSSFAKNNIMSAGWDKEIFPGMRYIIEKSSGRELSNDFIAHIFQKKKNVLMGATKKEDIYFGHNHLGELMIPYTKNIDSSENNFSKLAKTVFKNNSNIKIHSLKDGKFLSNGNTGKNVISLANKSTGFVNFDLDKEDDCLLEELAKEFDFL